MPDSKITALASIGTGTDPANDPLVIVDVSDVSPSGMSATGTTKKVTLNNLLACSPTATLASATITGDLTVDTSTLKVDSANNRVGIGTATPDNELSVRAASIATIDVRGGVGGAGGLKISGNGTTLGTTSFDLIQNSLGAIVYQRDALPLFFNVNGSERYAISSTGVATWSNVGGVAGTAMTLNSTGLLVGGTTAQIIAAESTTLTTIGNIGAAYSASTGTYFAAKVGAPNGIVELKADARSGAYPPMVFTTGNTQRMQIDASGNVGVGVTPSAGKGCLQLSSGINFPATQVASSDANTLDDYEEGTWTPTVSATSGTLTTTTVNAASYTKIGRFVSVQVDISIVNIGTASGLLLFSLPTGLNQVTDANVGVLRELGATGSMGQIIYQSATQVAVALYNNGTLIVNGYRFRGTYTYTTAT